MSTISNTDDVIDSRDVIARIEELETDLMSIHEETHEALSFEEWLASDDCCADSDEVQEYLTLKKLAEQGEDSSDWQYGETLIHRDYFVTYITELIDDCYELPKELDSGRWPYNCITVDYEQAASEAEVDYMSIDFDGQEYLIRA